jgi:hypothetical protein
MRPDANQGFMDQKMATAISFDTVGGPVPLRATSEWAALERRLGLAVLAVGNVDFAGVSDSLHDAPGDHLVANSTRSCPSGQHTHHPTNQWR